MSLACHLGAYRLLHESSQGERAPARAAGAHGVVRGDGRQPLVESRWMGHREVGVRLVRGPV